MSQADLLLIGAGGHARACIDVIEQAGRYRIAGLVGAPHEVGTKILGYPVLGADDDLGDLVGRYPAALVTVGQIRSPDTRIRLYQRAVDLGFHLPAIVSPHAHVSRHASIGAGTIVMHGAIVNAGACVGDNCIINTRALLEHDVTVGAHCHISTGAILNGDVKVGTGSFIGSGSVVREGVTLGDGALVGMGLCVRHDQRDQARFVGEARA